MRSKSPCATGHLRLESWPLLRAPGRRPAYNRPQLLGDALDGATVAGVAAARPSATALPWANSSWNENIAEAALVELPLASVGVLIGGHAQLPPAWRMQRCSCVHLPRAPGLLHAGHRLVEQPLLLSARRTVAAQREAHDTAPTGLLFQLGELRVALQLLDVARGGLDDRFALLAASASPPRAAAMSCSTWPSVCSTVPASRCCG